MVVVMVGVGGRVALSSAHRAGQTGGGERGERLAFMAARLRVGEREGVQLPERLAAGVPEGGARPGQVRGSLPLLLLLLLPGQQAAVYQPLGANGQLGVDVALAQRHHAGGCGHKEDNGSVKKN